MSTTPVVRVRGSLGEHFIVWGEAHPNDDEEDATYATMSRVRTWDANVRAGWMPIANGRKRMIPPDPEYSIE